MRVYTVHCRPGSNEPDADANLVREGFSWPAFLIPPLWLLYHRLWLALFLVTVAGLLLDVGIELVGADPATTFVIGLGFSLFIGLQANDWRRAKLTRYGHRMTGIVASSDHDGAMRRYFDVNPAHELPAFRQPHGSAIGGL
jgi:hypothetical protein